MSENTGIPANTISKIERGLTAIDLEQVEKISTSYGLLPEELISMARRNAAACEGKATVYQSDGMLDPSNTRGFVTPADHIAELLAREEDSSE